jgi:tetratricopeptide (TPR) repeat protein
VFKWALRDKSQWLWSGVVIAILSSYFVQNLLVFDMPSTYIMFALTLAFGSAVMSGREEGAEDIKSPDMRLVPLVGAVLVYFLFSYGVQSLQAGNWGIRISRGGLTTSEMIRLYEKTLSITRLGNRQIVEFFTERITNAIKQDAEQKIPLDFIYSVEKVMRKTAAKNPLDFRHAIILGDLYISARNRDPEFLKKGEETFLRARELSPANQQGYTLLAQTYIFKKEYETAEQLLLKALDLEPAYMRSYVALANFYELWGDGKKAEEFYKSAEKLGYKRE